ncbi:MAG: hypothetical protein WAL41_19990, partial [Mycobacterium sp.]
YAADVVRTRMYRNFSQLREGWTKNLALLFPRPGRLATKSLLIWSIPWAALLGIVFIGGHRTMSGCLGAIALVGVLFLTQRLRRANFTWDMEILGALFGYPMFSCLLLRSKGAHAGGSVSWKGRAYGGLPNGTAQANQTQAGQMQERQAQSTIAETSQV